MSPVRSTVAPTIQLSARLKGRLDDLRPAARAFLGSSFDRAVVEGPLDLALTAAGTPEQPTVVGSLAVDAATLGDGVHPPLTNVWLRTVLDRNVRSHRPCRAAVAGRAHGDFGIHSRVVPWGPGRRPRAAAPRFADISTT